jgi:hypothetical protein
MALAGVNVAPTTVITIQSHQPQPTGKYNVMHAHISWTQSGRKTPRRKTGLARIASASLATKEKVSK